MGRRNRREQVFNVRFVSKGVVKEASVVAIDHKQARRMAGAFPNVKSVAKARKDYDRIIASDFKSFTDKIMQDIAQPKMTPLAMDEFLWMRRKKRIENKEKDKE